MQWVFEQYATGEWSIRRLLDAATEKGLTSTGGPRTPSKPLSLGNFNRLLKNDYYIGIVTYRGVKYPGNHEPLVDEATFTRVQEILEAHAQSGEKQRKHRHYLKGSIFCGTCESRMIVHLTKNRHGTVYPYFVCLGRHEKRTNCTRRAVLIPVVEQQIVDEYHRRSLSSTTRRELEAFIHAELTVYLKDFGHERDRQQRRIDQLLAERKKLIQAHYADAIDVDQLREEQDRINTQLSTARAHLKAAEVTQEELEAIISRTLAKLQDCGERYETASPKVRREMNQSNFDKIMIHEEGEIDAKLAEELELLVHPDVTEAAREFARINAQKAVEEAEIILKLAEMRQNERTLAFAGQGSRNDWLVGVEGLEPPTLSL